jgi:hypothetical protein
MRPRSIVFLASSLWLLLGAEPASAQGCPEGDWFCEPAPEPAPSAEPEPGEAPEPEPQGPPKVARWRGAFLPDEPPHPPPRLRVRQPRPRWGFDIHLLGALMAGEDVDPDASMGGLGFGLRYRPIPYFAVDGTVELAFGTDYNGHDRSEIAGLLSAVAFFNPHKPIQAYILAGLGVSSAEISRGRETNLPGGPRDEQYSYFGMHLGAGVEGRLTRRAALRFDLVGFVRGRWDDGLRANPEFIDPDSNRVTNTSGGAFVRGGGIFYW